LFFQGLIQSKSGKVIGWGEDWPHLR
jgi:hypothetical protein